MEDARSGRPAPPVPGRPQSVDEFVQALKALLSWANMPSYRVLAKVITNDPAGIAVSHTTVADIFKPGRRRLDLDLVVHLLRALGLAPAEVTLWRDACLGAHAATQQAESVEALRQLPDELAGFVGRERELAELRSWLGARPAIGPAVVAVEGMAGIGKTQFAVRAAHRLVADGWGADVQLFTNLRGFDRQLTPIEPVDVLDSFLRRLGVPGSRIPKDLDGRAAMYRDRLAGRRALIVLDNAADEQQVRELLPNGAGSLVIVTSRRSLAGLDGVRHLPLPVFSPAEALELLRGGASLPKFDRHRPASARIAELCGYLPIAVALASQRLRARTAWTAENLAVYLRTHGLEGLSAGGHSVRAVFELSYRELGERHRRAYRLLSLHPGGAVTPAAAAALTGLDPVAAEAFLEDLVDQNLIQQRRPGVYELHDLLQAYAADLVAGAESEAERDDALRRLIDHYLHTCARAIRELEPGRRLAPAATGPAAGFFPHPDAAAWLHEESANLLAVARRADPARVVELAGTLADHLQALGLFAVDEQLQVMAVEAARSAGDLAAESRALLNLGANHAWTSYHRGARSCLYQALAGFRTLGDRRAQAEVLSTIGLSYDLSSELLASIEYHTAALAVFVEIGDEEWQGRMMCNLGFAYERLGDYRASLIWSQRSVRKLRAVRATSGGRCPAGDRPDRSRGGFEAAGRMLARSLQIARESGDRAGESAALTGLAFADERTGHPARALRRLEQALVVFQGTGPDGCVPVPGEGRAITVMETVLETSRHLQDRVLRDEVLSNLGIAFRRIARPGRAGEAHREAVDLAWRSEVRYESARAHQGLGDVCAELGDRDGARGRWQQALAEFTAMQLPEAGSLRALLADLDGDDPAARAPEVRV